LIDFNSQGIPLSLSLIFFENLFILEAIFAALDCIFLGYEEAFNYFEKVDDNYSTVFS